MGDRADQALTSEALIMALGGAGSPEVLTTATKANNTPARRTSSSYSKQGHPGQTYIIQFSYSISIGRF